MNICCIGDSLTLGYTDPTGRGWPGRLYAALTSSTRGVSCYNLGVRADTTPGVLKRWKAEATTRFRGGRSGMVFCFGTADANQKVPESSSLAACREILAEAPRLAPTLLLTPPPVSDPATNEQIRTLAAGFAKIAADFKVPCFDLFAALDASGSYKAALKRGDGAHPDAAGYDKMAEKLLGWAPLRTFFLAELA